MNKTELLSYIGARRTELESLWAGASEARMIAPATITPLWSVKDLIAHLYYWEQRVLNDVRLAVNGGTPTMEKDTESVNTQNYLAHRDRSLEAVVANFQRSHDEMLKFVETISDDILTDTQRFTWADNGSLAGHIAYEYLDHYDDHLPDLRAWNQSVQAQTNAPRGIRIHIRF
jgi:hypothetical protein